MFGTRRNQSPGVSDETLDWYSASQERMRYEQLIQLDQARRRYWEAIGHDAAQAAADARIGDFYAVSQEVMRYHQLAELAQARRRYQEQVGQPTGQATGFTRELRTLWSRLEDVSTHARMSRVLPTGRFWLVGPSSRGWCFAYDGSTLSVHSWAEVQHLAAHAVRGVVEIAP